ncbi:hypothetical protein HYDPIDRAFT_187111 [Hydnomerulius pinastri MD-312]|nr:hypothetical protein HYDPIDRAFT_187111 [Hydnomerulius pinastri MD-312]
MTTHTVNMTNNCGFGVPTLDQIPSITLATGSQSYTNGTVQAGAFLNTGYCGPNGGNCTTVDITMNDTISVVVVDLIPTHIFNVPVGFTFWSGCDGAGVSCLSSNCVNAIRDPSEDSGIVTCSMPGASLLVTFCPNLEPATSSTTASSTSTSVAAPPSTAPAPSSTSHSSNAALIGGVVGGVVLIVVIIGAIYYFRRRRPKVGEEYSIEEFTAPAPYSPLPPNSEGNYPVTSIKKTPYGSLHNIQPSVTSVEPSGTTSPISPISQQSGPRPLPLPPQSPSSSVPSAPSTDTGGSPRSPDLDRIIEGLAERFGWTVPPSGGDSLPPSTRHNSIQPPPSYR